jgi:hypothetical protein
METEERMPNYCFFGRVQEGSATDPIATRTREAVPIEEAGIQLI